MHLVVFNLKELTACDEKHCNNCIKIQFYIMHIFSFYYPSFLKRRQNIGGSLFRDFTIEANYLSDVPKFILVA